MVVSGTTHHRSPREMTHLGCSICISSVIVAISRSLTASFFSRAVVRACMNSQSLLSFHSIPQAMSLLAPQSATHQWLLHLRGIICWLSRLQRG